LEKAKGLPKLAKFEFGTPNGLEKALMGLINGFEKPGVLARMALFNMALLRNLPVEMGVPNVALVVVVVVAESGMKFPRNWKLNVPVDEGTKFPVFGSNASFVVRTKDPMGDGTNVPLADTKSPRLESVKAPVMEGEKAPVERLIDPVVDCTNGPAVGMKVPRSRTTKFPVVEGVKVPVFGLNDSRTLRTKSPVAEGVKVPLIGSNPRRLARVNGLFVDGVKAPVAGSKVPCDVRTNVPFGVKKGLLKRLTNPLLNGVLNGVPKAGLNGVAKLGVNALDCTGVTGRIALARRKPCAHPAFPTRPRTNKDANNVITKRLMIAHLHSNTGIPRERPNHQTK
jgi:hypothetical protein